MTPDDESLDTYDEGSLVTVSTNPPFTDATGTPTDPTDVYFEWQVFGLTGALAPATTWHFRPPSTSVSGSIVRDSAGTFHVEMNTENFPGRWQHRWVGTGAVQAAVDGEFDVTPRTVAGDE